MQSSSLYVLFTTAGVILVVILYAVYVTYLGSKYIFHGSGVPISMAKILLSSIHMTAQILFGVLVVGIVCVMIMEDKIKSDAGLPIISGIVGYLLGKSFKDVYEGKPKNLQADTKKV